jgi:hypothetical protein
MWGKFGGRAQGHEFSRLCAFAESAMVALTF